MITGRKYRVKALGKESREMFFTWSAAQMLIYNALVQERMYFLGFFRKFGGKLPPIDQKYSHLINREDGAYAWMHKVPSQIFRKGAVLHKKAWSNYFAGITRQPIPKRVKGADRSLWLTQELFSIKQVSKNWYELSVGTKTISGGRFLFKAHRPFTEPVSVHLKSSGTEIFISFSCEEEFQQYPETKAEKIARLSQYGKDELLNISVGIDRGVVTPFQLSDGRRFDYSQTQKDRLKASERRKKHYQRMMARRIKGSSNWKKAKEKARRCSRYAAYVRRDFAHKTSHAIVGNESVEIIGIEDLKIKSMTARPEPKKFEDEEFLPNGANAKAGLNKAILEKAWGLTERFIEYKAQRAGKLIIKVPAPYTSQTCSRCGCQAKTNRKSQALFRCTHCGFTQNADRNAAEVIKAKAVELFHSEGIKPKEVRRTMRLRHKPACASA